MLLEDSSYKRKSRRRVRVRVTRGELVQTTKSDQWIIAYSNPPIFIDCQKDEVKTVNRRFVPYLLAVENLISRYDLFINKLNSLAKCVLLKVGDRIDVILEQYAVPSSAIVRYKGELPRKKGIFFGVEILVRKSVYITLVKYVATYIRSCLCHNFLCT